jgi:hypothetical protein
MKLLPLVTLTGVSLAVLGCGGGTGTPGGTLGGSCPSSFTPCGGNLVGTWHLETECTGSSSSSSVSCPGISISLGYAATYTFGPTGTFTFSSPGSMSETVRYPAECLHSDAGAVLACADMSSAMQSAAQHAGDAGTSTITFTGGSCSADPSGICVCNESFTYSSTSGTGTYTTSGTKVTISSLSGTGMPDAGAGDAGTSLPNDYCVSGNTLMIQATSFSGSTTVIVMTK